MKYLLKSLIRFIPFQLRAMVYHLPGIGYRLKSAFASLFATQNAEWFEFKSGPRRGIKMQLKLPEENEFFLETHDPTVTQLLCRFLRPSQVFIDVGAHIGYFTLLASKLVGLTGKVFAIEASPNTAARLKEHLIANECTNTSCFEVAASDRNGEHALVEFKAHTLDCLKPETGQEPLPHEGHSSIGSRSVPCKSLDSFLGEGLIQAPDFIKIDVEGAEIKVVHGMEKLLRLHKPLLLIEHHHVPALEEIPHFLASRGYCTYRVDTKHPSPYDLKPLTEISELRQGFHLLFVHEPYKPLKVEFKKGWEK